MKKVLIALLAGSFILTGCFETTQEITLNEDGSGTLSTTNDLSAALTLAKNMGGSADMDKLTAKQFDTTFSLASQADSAKDLSPADRKLFSKGNMTMKLNGKEEKFITKVVFPFANTDEIGKFNKLTGKVFGNSLKGMMGESGQDASIGEQLPEVSSFDDYYKIEYSKDEIKKSLDKDKYAKVENDEFLKGLKETASMGIPVNSTFIINLPRPATKVEGKNVTLSEDKRKVTIKADIDDFFDSPEKLEFKVKF